MLGGQRLGGNACRSEQVIALRQIYEGAKNPRTGASIHPTLARGGEPHVADRDGDRASCRSRTTTSAGRYSATPGWDWRKFDFDKDVALANQKTGAVLNAIDPDLGKFRGQGGKLLLYHGWSDQVIFPEGSINYQQSVADKLVPGKGVAGVQDFFRLFMVPGMAHCRGGSGTDRFDAQSAIEALGRARHGAREPRRQPRGERDPDAHAAALPVSAGREVRRQRRHQRRREFHLPVSGVRATGQCKESEHML